MMKSVKMSTYIDTLNNESSIKVIINIFILLYFIALNKVYITKNTDFVINILAIISVPSLACAFEEQSKDFINYYWSRNVIVIMFFRRVNVTYSAQSKERLLLLVEPWNDVSFQGSTNSQDIWGNWHLK